MSREEKKITILDAALRIFAKYGYKKTTVEDIAGDLDMTKGNLYLYAKNKRDLYEMCVRKGLLDWQNNAYKASENKSGALEKIVAYCTHGFDYLCKNKDLKTIISGDKTIFPLSPTEDRFREINGKSIELLKSMLDEGIRSGELRGFDSDEVAELLYSVYVMFIIKTYVKDEGEATMQMMETGFDIIINGLRKREGEF